VEAYCRTTSGGDLPRLRYAWFSFDACNTGRDYIEVFQHGTYFYTIALSGAVETTADFIQALVEGQTPSQLKIHLNTRYSDPTNAYYQFVP